MVDSGITVDSWFDRGEKTHLSSSQLNPNSQFSQYDSVATNETRLMPGATIDLDPDVTMAVVASNGHVRGAVGHYEVDGPSHNENFYSIALLISYEGFNYFVGGDLTSDIEERIVEQAALGDIDVYKVSHHGSATSSTAALLELIRPEVAIISNGSESCFNHPRQSVLDTLGAIPGIVIFQTNRLKDEHLDQCQSGAIVSGNVADANIADPETDEVDGHVTIVVSDGNYVVSLPARGTSRTFSINGTLPTGRVPENACDADARLEPVRALECHFARNLLRRFPFHGRFGPQTRDAAPDDVRQLLTLLDRVEPDVALPTTSGLTEALYRAKPALETLLGDERSRLTFRITESRHATEIAEWSVVSGWNGSSSSERRLLETVWRVGDRLTVSLTLAHSSRFRFLPREEGLSMVDGEGRVLSFEFLGAWGLWRLLDRHGLSDEPSSNSTVTVRLDFDLVDLSEVEPGVSEASWVVLEVEVLGAGGGQAFDLRLPSAVGWSR